MGKTGSGKGTQAALLARSLHYTAFSSGEAFRNIREEDSHLGKKVKEEYDTGIWLPYWFASYLFQDALLHLKDGAGIVLEGVGRREQEARVFDEVTTWLERPYLVFNLEISDEESRHRQELRHRDLLDTPEMITKRLEEYKDHTIPALEFFRSKGVVIDVNGQQPIDVIHQDIMNHLKIRT